MQELFPADIRLVGCRASQGRSSARAPGLREDCPRQRDRQRVRRPLPPHLSAGDCLRHVRCNPCRSPMYCTSIRTISLYEVIRTSRQLQAAVKTALGCRRVGGKGAVSVSGGSCIGAVHHLHRYDWPSSVSSIIAQNSRLSISTITITGH